jgi:hypothetical protein
MDDDKGERIQLSQEELNTLPDKVRRYISGLENELKSIRQNLYNNEDELRRKRFAYWKR